MKTENYIFEQTKPNQYNGRYDFPEKLEAGKVYFCREYEMSVHLCPCGCGAEVYLAIRELNIKNRFWGLSGNTIHPSVRRLVGCKSHYYIKNGLTVWARE